MPVGTAGKVRFQKLGPRRVRARANYRDHDGEVREVTRYGPTQAAAERRLREAIRDRTAPRSDGEITPDTRLRDAAALWLDEVSESGDLTAQSREIYERAATRITKALGGLLLREIDVPTCDRMVKTVRANHGPSAAKTSKSVLSLILGMAVRHGALPANPVRDVAKISTGRKARPKALTRDDESVMLAKVAGDERAAELDAADLIEFLDGTGMRVGEALGVRAEVVDLEAGVIEVNATAARLKGKGTVLQERPKTEAGWRVIALPPHLVELCRRRMGMSWPHGDRKITASPRRARRPSVRPKTSACCSPAFTAGCAIRATPTGTSRRCSRASTPSGSGGSPATRSARRSRPDWTTPACPRERSPITSGTRSRA